MKTLTKISIILFFILGLFSTSCSNRPVNDWVYYQAKVVDPPEPEQWKPYDTLRYHTAKAEASSMKKDVSAAISEYRKEGMYRDSETTDQLAASAADEHYNRESEQYEHTFTIHLNKVYSSAYSDKPIIKTLRIFEYGNRSRE